MILEKIITFIMKTNNVTSEKQIATNKENVIAKRKEEIKNQTSTNKSIIDLDLESLDLDNIKSLLSKSNIKTDKNVNERFQMYKFERLELTEKEEKRQRTKIRKQRNKLVDNILYFFSNEKQKELVEEIKSFNKFYLDTYTLNDYSLKSLCNDNSDKDTKEKITFVLAIISKQK